MIIQHLQYPLEALEYHPSVLAIGYFDGVHQGHRRVIQKAMDVAKEKGLSSAVMTFHPHPREILGQSGYTHYLTPLEEKLNLLEKMGIELAYVVDFDIPFSSVYPQDFINEFLIPLQARHIVVGFDYTFGYRGKGTAFTLQEYSHNRYGLDVVSPITRYGEKISSTIIREYLYGGKIQEATEFLGRPYSIKGIVIHGEKRGRQIGFPTANIGLEDPYLIPRTGVYAVRIYFEEKILYGVMNIGIKPTFEQEKKEKSLEVYIFDFSENMYDMDIRVDFLFFIREEQKFAGVEQLVNQIRQDVSHAKSRIFGT
ncbi:bifunctional riboflavin kinase/FAD synthetase [Ammoniphilus sp. CFH 90114]|uniref:bifunctional riboflavin kinase/FAD synthetase n=1 Tax=Ammoniphilus sp. CFH 90114 TaxID=2493665 RepID=UPI00100EDDC9|nr:bifunctional riboflavin kinase/FAD synthetase [Ammoniphilus sp. CFH 90114]RXT15160.1 bifunctional riboflavin kinase/FAD synthetase [Ammoniphilus sp. CFH 90114]